MRLYKTVMGRYKCWCPMFINFVLNSIFQIENLKKKSELKYQAGDFARLSPLITPIANLPLLAAE